MSTLLLLLAAFLLVDAARARDDWSRERRIATLVGAASCVLLAVATIPNILYLQKVLGRLAMPPGLLWLVMAGGLAWTWHRRRMRESTIIAAFFVAYTVVGSPAAGSALLYSLEREFRSIDAFEAGPFDAVFVMGGGTGVDPHGRPFLTLSGDRVLLGARLHEAGRTEIVVTSGSTIEGIGVQRDIADEAAVLVRAMGVPDRAILRLPAPKNSSQEIEAYAAMARERQWDRVGLVTSAWHLRRSMRLAERAGLPAEPLPADFRGSLHWNGFLSIVPDGRGFRDVSTACWEYLGAAVGR